jgi:hypothetical protein
MRLLFVVASPVVIKEVESMNKNGKTDMMA